MGHIHQGGQLRKNQAKIIIFGPLREKTPHLARAQQRLSSLPRQQPETAAVSGHPGCCYRCQASGGPPQAPPTASQPPEYTQRRPGAAGDGHRPPARAARCRFWLICDLAGFGFVNLFGPLLNQKLGGFASYYFIVWGGVGGGGPRRKNPEIFTNPRLDSPIGNFAASYSTFHMGPGPMLKDVVIYLDL